MLLLVWLVFFDWLRTVNAMSASFLFKLVTDFLEILKLRHLMQPKFLLIMLIFNRTQAYQTKSILLKRKTKNTFTSALLFCVYKFITNVADVSYNTSASTSSCVKWHMSTTLKCLTKSSLEM